MFAFGPPRTRTRPSLTPMIDVVFLLLIFFMLAARFGQSGVVPLAPAGTGAGYSGPPRLVSVAPDAVRLNGVLVDDADLAGNLAALTQDPGDTIVLRAAGGADLQRLVDVVETLRAAGFSALVLAE